MSSSEREEQVKLLMVPPEREGNILVWIEIIDDEPETMFWAPETPGELEEAERFLKACDAIDWSEPDIQEVRY